MGSCCQGRERPCGLFKIGKRHGVVRDAGAKRVLKFEDRPMASDGVAGVTQRRKPIGQLPAEMDDIH
jgi:hypothetical protein